MKALLQSMLALMLLFGITQGQSIIQTNPVQGTYKLGILFAQFADSAENENARGSWGYIDTSSPADGLPDIGIEHKYRYKHYWNLFFQDEGEVEHPDAGSHWGIVQNQNLHVNLANRNDLHIHGSVTQYWREVSYGNFIIAPGQTRENESGIINKVEYEGTDPSEGKIRWLVLDNPKSSYDIDNAISEALQKANQIDDFEPDNFNRIFVIVAGGGWGIARPRGQGAMFTTNNPLYSQIFSIGATIHELGHSYQDWPLSFSDVHNRDVNNSNWVGHYSLMGQINTFEGALTPMHLDPFHKLQVGWLDYILVSEVLENIDLPIVEEKFNNGKPYVLVIPVKGDFTPPIGSGTWQNIHFYYS